MLLTGLYSPVDFLVLCNLERNSRVCLDNLERLWREIVGIVLIATELKYQGTLRHWLGRDKSNVVITIFLVFQDFFDKKIPGNETDLEIFDLFDQCTCISVSVNLKLPEAGTRLFQQIPSPRSNVC